MEKITQRAITYSLLAHIRGKGKLVGGPIDVFVPLIKMAISKLNEKGVFSGKNISEIKLVADEMFGIDFPNPVLRKILEKIAKEINTEEEKKIILFNDGAYQIKNYTFSEFEETIRVKKIEIEKLESLFKDFCATCKNPPSETSSIIAFIEKNKFGLSKYLANKNLESDKDYSNEAKFIEFFKIIPSVYNEIKKIYLGSILSGFLEYKTDNIKTNVELLLDTNFILGLIDLNTKESTHTCRKIVEIANAQGYKLKILQDTIIETVSLLKAKSSNFDTSFLQKSIYPEDIYNACERRKLNKADLERIADKLENELLRFNIYKIPETSKYRNQAKTSHEFKNLKKYRNTDQAALHDTIAIFYVREKRKKRIKDFENVNCWFVNNAISREKIEIDDSFGKDKDQFQPETIKADDFLNIIWLSNPQINISIDSDELSEIGLSALISLTLNESLPRNEVIREIDDNIQKYAKDGALSDSDIVRIATRITNRQISDLENLSKLAEHDSEAFIKRLNEEATFFPFGKKPCGESEVQSSKTKFKINFKFQTG